MSSTLHSINKLALKVLLWNKLLYHCLIIEFLIKTHDDVDDEMLWNGKIFKKCQNYEFKQLKGKLSNYM